MGFMTRTVLLTGVLLVLGDANMYQHFSASLTARGATRATTFLVAAVAIVESLIILSAWVSFLILPFSMILEQAPSRRSGALR